MKKALLFITIPFLLSLACSKESNIIDPNVVGKPIPSNNLPIDSTQKIVIYPEAGVKFLTGHIIDSSYLKRAATQIPSIQIGKNGVLYCAWYANSSTESQHGEGAGTYATLAVSIDNGETWLENRLIIAPLDMNDCIFSPELWMDPMGNIHLIWSKAFNWWDGKGGVWETIITYKDRWITNTGAKVFMEKGTVINKPIILEGSNKAFYANYMFNFDDKLQAETNVYVVDLPTTDSEIPIPSFYSKVPIRPNNLKTVYPEPQFFQVGDSLTCYIREENSGIYFSKASIKDDLKTWTLFKPLTSIGDNPPVKFYIGRLLSGNVLLVTCNDKIRKNMTAYLSKDNGVTFPYKLLLDSRKQVSYADVSQGTDGTIYVVYDRERNVAKEILFTKFKESDIINNKKIIVKKINSF